MVFWMSRFKTKLLYERRIQQVPYKFDVVFIGNDEHMYLPWTEERKELRTHDLNVMLALIDEKLAN